MKAECVPDKKEFIKLAKHGNLIPVYAEIEADLLTPVSAFLRIKGRGYSYLLESVEGEEKLARYSFLGSDPSLVFKSTGRQIEIKEYGRVRRYKTDKDPLFEIKNIMAGYSFVPVKGLPRFCGGLVGYIGYDMVRFFENIPDKNLVGLDLPDSVFVLTDTILIFDHVMHKIKIVSNAYIKAKKAAAVYAEAVGKIERIIKSLSGAGPSAPEEKKTAGRIRISSNCSKGAFYGMVRDAKRYIRNGDIIQAVLSQRFSTELGSREPFRIYRNLRSINPSPYMYYLDFKDIRLIGSSPEIMVRCEDGRVELRPIAGTRPRGRDDAEDARLQKELLSDPKEKAEHIMLVDLGRNDVGRVCSFNSVKVRELMRVEKYSHVMHISSDITGRLKDQYDEYDVVRASFPAGTVTGAPKIRAMEIIDELEAARRGPYAGCVGYFSFSGNVDTCITIRTILVHRNIAYIQAGAGIVADSRPEREYKETVNKARALIKAIEEA